jgi:hypothetical protein
VEGHTTALITARGVPAQGTEAAQSCRKSGGIIQVWVSSKRDFSLRNYIDEIQVERSKFKGLFTLLSFHPEECACLVNVYFAE